MNNIQLYLKAARKHRGCLLIEMRRPHRLLQDIYKLKFGSVPHGAILKTKCGNLDCINIDHIYISCISKRKTLFVKLIEQLTPAEAARLLR